jgi:hypothetical protein
VQVLARPAGGVRHLIGNPAHVPDSQLSGAVLTSAS